MKGLWPLPVSWTGELEAKRQVLEDQLSDANDRYDFVIRNHMPGVGNALQSKKIADQRKVVCAAPDYLTRNGSP